MYLLHTFISSSLHASVLHHRRATSDAKYRCLELSFDDSRIRLLIEGVAAAHEEAAVEDVINHSTIIGPVVRLGIGFVYPAKVVKAWPGIFSSVTSRSPFFRPSCFMMLSRTTG